MSRLHVCTGSRLHFGLLGWGPHVRRQFGGVGLMIEAPGLELSAEPSDQFEAEGPTGDRVASLLDRIEDRWTEANPIRRVRAKVVRTPKEHTGLGVGTQLSLAAAWLALAAAGIEKPTLEQFARLSERGRRSGVGLHGFLHGGLIVDAGHNSPDDIPPLASRLEFPEDWSILVVRPPAPPGRHGRAEAAAFATLPPFAERTSERLCRLVLLDLLGAVSARDLAGFGAALEAIQLEVGAAFAPAQGGVYASAESAALAHELSRLGLVGVGQSSWGPSMYGFGMLDANERDDIAAQLQTRHDLPPDSILWTRARNRGAELASQHRPVDH